MSAQGEPAGNVATGDQSQPLPKFGTFPLPSCCRDESGKAVIQTLDSLKEHLQTALIVELSTIPLYLYAMYSIVEGDTSGARDNIHAIVVEEMLHLVLAGNVLKSIGGTPTLYHAPNWPVYPMDMIGHTPPLSLQLRKFDLAQIDLFIQVELPQTSNPQAGADEYHTIGEFYRTIQQALKDVKPPYGSPEFQFSPDDDIYFPQGSDPGDVTVAVDEGSATGSLEIIIDQGEGHYTDPSLKDAGHYERFQKVRGNPPTCYPLLDNPKTKEYTDTKIQAVSNWLDATYCFFLLSLEETWKTSRGDANKRTGLIDNVRPIMTDVLAPLAKFFVTQPLNDPQHPGENAGPAFNFFEFSSAKTPLQQVQDLATQAINSFGSGLAPSSLQSAAQETGKLYQWPL